MATRNIPESLSSGFAFAVDETTANFGKGAIPAATDGIYFLNATMQAEPFILRNEEAGQGGAPQKPNSFEDVYNVTLETYMRPAAMAGEKANVDVILRNLLGTGMAGTGPARYIYQPKASQSESIALYLKTDIGQYALLGFSVNSANFTFANRDWVRATWTGQCIKAAAFTPFLGGAITAGDDSISKQGTGADARDNAAIGSVIKTDGNAASIVTAVGSNSLTTSPAQANAVSAGEEVVDGLPTPTFSASGPSAGNSGSLTARGETVQFIDGSFTYNSNKQLAEAFYGASGRTGIGRPGVRSGDFSFTVETRGRDVERINRILRAPDYEPVVITWGLTGDNERAIRTTIAGVNFQPSIPTFTPNQFSRATFAGEIYATSGQNDTLIEFI